ncbi:DUF1573 domain-containing protein [Pedobacter polaris]|uniref:DUF1573 domain-containing protein n=1 Tax=Pedobacter polaris TaxID=2571273 RepID=A0A4U1CXN9_9SPHI|nr:DUF1573 domain-containing protein [Pedobacter polaris]TKC13180.1 DUF1573 domain-containing protein [Pedobacter polaris]
MKKLIFLFTLVLGFIAITAMKIDTEPQFKFVEPNGHDFGKIIQGKPVSVEMKFTNIGDKPLIISSVEPTCGCTIAKFTTTPVLKGKMGSITLTYNAAALGTFNKNVTVKSNATEPSKAVYFKGEVIAESTTTKTSSK